MILTKQVVSNNLKKFDHFAECYTQINQIEKNITEYPDVAIESCKSLVESVSKTILKHLDNTYTEQKAKDMLTSKLFKDALIHLQQYNIEIEDDFVKKSGAIITCLNELRNERGDISHGKTLPKIKKSLPEFALLIMSVTDGLLFYVLTNYFRLDTSYKVNIKYESNSRFNGFLDESNAVLGITYSRALYDQDYNAYIEQLRGFEVELE